MRNLQSLLFATLVCLCVAKADLHNEECSESGTDQHEVEPATVDFSEEIDHSKQKDVGLSAVQTRAIKSKRSWKEDDENQVSNGEHLLSLDSISRQVAALEAHPVTAQQDLDKVLELINVLTNKFEGELKNQSQSDQNRFNHRGGNHQTCIDHKNKRFKENTGDVWLAAEARGTKKNKHKKCRKFKKSLDTLTSKSGTVGQGTWDTLAKNDMTETGELCTAVNTYDTDKNAYKNAAPSNEVSDSCAYDQSLYEESQCLWIEVKKSACIALDQCIDAVDLSSTKEEIKKRTQNRKSIYESIQKLKCRLRHIHDIYNHSKPVSDNNKTDDCETTYPFPPEFDLNLTIPNVNKCSDDTDINEPSMLYPNKPADTDQCESWRQNNYDFSDEYDQVTECEVACVIPPDDNVNPNPPETGCQDLEAYCDFYKRHWTACGKYSDDVTKCCACGGGYTPKMVTQTVIGTMLGTSWQQVAPLGTDSSSLVWCYRTGAYGTSFSTSVCRTVSPNMDLGPELEVIDATEDHAGQKGTRVSTLWAQSADASIVCMCMHWGSKCNVLREGSNGALTKGPDLTNAAIYGDPSGARLTDEKAIFCYSGLDHWSYCQVVTVSGSTMTQHAALRFGAHGHSAPRVVTGLSGNAGILTIMQATSAQARSQRVGFTVDGTTITLGVQGPILPHDSYVYPKAGVALTNDMAVVCYEKGNIYGNGCGGSNSRNGGCIVFTKDGTAVVQGPHLDLGAVPSDNGASMVKLSDSKLVYCYTGSPSCARPLVCQLLSVTGSGTGATLSNSSAVTVAIVEPHIVGFASATKKSESGTPWLSDDVEVIVCYMNDPDGADHYGPHKNLCRRLKYDGQQLVKM